MEVHLETRKTSQESRIMPNRPTLTTQTAIRTTSRPYVGCNGVRREVFRSVAAPTESSHGARFAAVIGPFRTARGARFMAQHGAGNPHCRTVAEAERLARRA